MTQPDSRRGLEMTGNGVLTGGSHDWQAEVPGSALYVHRRSPVVVRAGRVWGDYPGSPPWWPWRSQPGAPVLQPVCIQPDQVELCHDTLSSQMYKWLNMTVCGSRMLRCHVPTYQHSRGGIRDYQRARPCGFVGLRPRPDHTVQGNVTGLQTCARLLLALRMQCDAPASWRMRLRVLGEMAGRSGPWGSGVIFGRVSGLGGVSLHLSP